MNKNEFPFDNKAYNEAHNTEPITEEEKKEIMEYEALVQMLTKDWNRLMKEVSELEAIRRNEYRGTCGHPSQEE